MPVRTFATSGVRWLVVCLPCCRAKPSCSRFAAGAEILDCGCVRVGLVDRSLTWLVVLCLLSAFLQWLLLTRKRRWLRPPRSPPTLPATTWLTTVTTVAVVVAVVAVAVAAAVAVAVALAAVAPPLLPKRSRK